jgi:hypothetical protein
LAEILAYGCKASTMLRYSNFFPNLAQNVKVKMMEHWRRSQLEDPKPCYMLLFTGGLLFL